MLETIKTVPLHSINLEDKTFVTTSRCRCEQLKNAIAAVGLINPPRLFFSSAPGYYQIVCGYRRIHALISLGWQETPAYIIPPLAEKKQLVLMSFYDNLPHRVFDPLEQALIVDHLRRYSSEAEAVRDYLPLLSLPPTLQTLAHLRSLLQLEKELQDALIDGKLAQSVAAKLAQVPSEDRLAFSALLSQVHLSVSKQEEIFASSLDLARRENTSIAALLNDPELIHILGNEKITRSQKGDRVRAWLKKRRFPRLTRHEERFQRLSKILHLPQRVHLLHPPFFEGGRYNLQIEFEQVEELQDQLRQVACLVNNPVLEQLVEDEE